MTRTKYLKGECQHCGGHLEFPAEMAGMASPCPHCGQQTDLLLALPPEEPPVMRRALLWTLGAVVILVVGLGASLVALKRAENYAARRKAKLEAQNAKLPIADTNAPNAETQVAAQLEQSGFNVSPISLEKTPGSSLVYAVATVKNTTGRQRFAVRIEFELLDDLGNKVGTAKDYQQVMEAGAEWHCKALVVESKAASARLAGLKEDQ
jgi:hypothetical protein